MANSVRVKAGVKNGWINKRDITHKTPEKGSGPRASKKMEEKSCCRDRGDCFHKVSEYPVEGFHCMLLSMLCANGSKKREKEKRGIDAAKTDFSILDEVPSKGSSVGGSLKENTGGPISGGQSAVIGAGALDSEMTTETILAREGL